MCILHHDYIMSCKTVTCHAFSRVLQGSVPPPHGVARNRHLLWVSGEVSVDLMRELRERGRVVSGTAVSGDSQ